MGISNFMFPGLPQCPRCGPGTRRRWVREQGAATTGPGTPTAGPQDAAAGWGAARRCSRSMQLQDGSNVRAFCFRFRIVQDNWLFEVSILNEDEPTADENLRESMDIAYSFSNTANGRRWRSPNEQLQHWQNNRRKLVDVSFYWALL